MVRLVFFAFFTVCWMVRVPTMAATSCHSYARSCKSKGTGKDEGKKDIMSCLTFPCRSNACKNTVLDVSGGGKSESEGGRENQG